MKIRSQRLQGLVLNAFCLRKHLTRLRSIEAQYTRTGFGGMWVRDNVVIYVTVVLTMLSPCTGKQGRCEHKNDCIWSQRLYSEYSFNSS